MKQSPGADMPGGATPTETLGDVGEFGLIQRIRRLFPGTEPTVVHGIGDDVAVVRTDSDHLLLVTCDCQIEGVHFLRHALNFWDLGWRAASVNLSDLAAMGGEPLWAVVSLMAPAELPVKAVEDLYRGMADALRPWQATVVGGNTARHPDRLVVDVTLLGRARPDGIVTRDGARPGDVIVVTGTLGGARAGLEWARGRVAGDAPEVRKQAMARYRTPRARVAEGKALAATGRVRAMLDVSDGLLGDLRHLCQASGVGALVEAACIPVDPCCRQTALSVGADPLEWALRGGEDYELLFSVDRQGGVGQVMEALGAVSDVAFAVIGWIVPREAGIQVVFPDGTRRSLTAEGGWDHFGSRPDK